MNRRPIWVLACLAACSCQTARVPAAPRSDADCPTPNPCDDPGPEARLVPGLTPGPGVTLVAYQPMKPGCPSTLQVMAWRRPIAFQAVKPGAAPDTEPDLSDSVCEEPEAPLLRAGRDRQRQRFVDSLGTVQVRGAAQGQGMGAIRKN